MSPNDNSAELQIYESVSKFREMTAVEFCEYMGIEFVGISEIDVECFGEIGGITMLFWICLVAFVVSVVCFIVGLEKNWSFCL